MLGGVTERHPAADSCIPHGGGVMAFLAEKFAFAADTRPWVPEHLRDGGFLRHPRSLWFDSHMGAPAEVLQDHSRIAGVMKGGQLFRG